MDEQKEAVELQTWTDWPGEERKTRRWKTYVRTKFTAISLLLLVLR